jgi:hypothetical protein
MNIQQYLFIFYFFTVVNLTGTVEKLSDIKDDSVLMWKLLHKLKGTRILAPGQKSQEIIIFPKDKKLPPEIMSRILRFANIRMLKNLPANPRLIREFIIPIPTLVWPQGIEKDPLTQQLWLDNNRIVVYNRSEAPFLIPNGPHPVSLPTARILNIAENKCSGPVYPPQFESFIPPEKKNIRCSIGDDDSVEVIIDGETYNRINNLPSANSDFDPAWLDSLRDEEHHSPDKTKYIVIQRKNIDLRSESFKAEETLEVYHAQTRELIRTFPPKNANGERNFQWSVDNKLAIRNRYSNGNNIIEVYDFEQPFLDEPCCSIRSIRLNSKNFTDFSFSSKSSFLALNSYNPHDHSQKIEFFDAQMGKLLFVLDNQKFGYWMAHSLPYSIWSPDESVICVRTHDNMPRIYSIKDKETAIEYFAKNSEAMEQFLLFMLLRFNFTQEELNYIKSKLPQHLSQQLDSFLSLK